MKNFKNNDTNNNDEDTDVDDNDNTDKRQFMIAMAHFGILKMSHRSKYNRLH